MWIENAFVRRIQRSASSAQITFRPGVDGSQYKRGDSVDPGSDRVEMRKIVISVVGPNTNDDKLLPMGEALGRSIAEAGFVLLTGGRNRGVMDAAAKGARVGADAFLVLLGAPGSGAVGCTPLWLCIFNPYIHP